MQHRKTLMLVLTALFAALTAVGAFFKIPFALAAISLQFLFTAMAGILLGAGYGALSQLVYVLIGLVGVPIFALGEQITIENAPAEAMADLSELRGLLYLYEDTVPFLARQVARAAPQRFGIAPAPPPGDGIFAGDGDSANQGIVEVE